MVASEPPHRLRDEPRKRRPTGVAKRAVSLPEGADMAESPAGPRGFAERATSSGAMGDAPLAAEIEASRVALCRSSRKTPVRFCMTTSLGPGTGLGQTLGIRLRPAFA
jgi:hypothetical protein